MLFVNTSGRLTGNLPRTRFCEKQHRGEGRMELSVGMGVGGGASCGEEEPLKRR